MFYPVNTAFEINEKSGINGSLLPFAINIINRSTYKAYMKLQQLYSQVRRAVDDYNMIQEGDKIAVGISGGKDSLTLLYALQGLRRFYPAKFDLEAVTVDLGFPESMEALEPIQALCDRLEVNYTIIPTRINEIVFKARKEDNPCSLCAKMRKGALNDQAVKLGCNKVAYGHHMDDLVETMMMSLIYEGRFYAFPPVTNLERSGLTVIRPMMYVHEADVIGFKNRYGLPVFSNSCSADGTTRREYVKKLIRSINRDNPGSKDRMYHAILEGNIFDWPKKAR